MNNEESAITGKSQRLTKINKIQRKVKIGYKREGGGERGEVGQFWNDSHEEK